MNINYFTNKLIKEFVCLLLQFIVITVILFLIEFTVGVWSMVIWSEVEAESNQLMAESFGQFISNGDDRKQWVRLQTKVWV